MDQSLTGAPALDIFTDDLKGRGRRSYHESLRLIPGLLMALGATTVLIFDDDPIWLRLGVVAALSAALTEAFIATSYRSRIMDSDARAADLQAIYKLELEREIAARRELELQVEAQVCDKVSAEFRQNVAALHAEVRALRRILEALFGGDALVGRQVLLADSINSIHIDDSGGPSHTKSGNTTADPPLRDPHL